jgi:hypothetical protein
MSNFLIHSQHACYAALIFLFENYQNEGNSFAEKMHNAISSNFFFLLIIYPLRCMRYQKQKILHRVCVKKCIIKKIFS